MGRGAEGGIHPTKHLKPSTAVHAYLVVNDRREDMAQQSTFFWLALVTTVILGVAPTVDISWIFPQLRLKSLIHTDAGIVMSQSIPRTVHYKVYRSNAATATNMLQSSVMSKTTIKLQYNCNFG